MTGKGPVGTVALRILHVIKALGRGGAEVLLAEGLRVADRNRFDFRYVYLQRRPDEVVADLRALGAPVESLHLESNVSMLLGARRLARHIEREKIDLVHAHLPVAGVVARAAGRLAEVPVVYTEHAPPHRYRSIPRWLNLLTWTWQDRVIAISDDVAFSIARHAPRRVPITTIWNGIDTRKFDPALFNGDEVREELKLHATSPIVGTVAVFRNTPQKRLDIWLEAARVIHEAEPYVQFLLVGDGPLRSKLEAQAARLGLAEVTHFVGRHADVRPYLAAMDVFLVSSAYEGFGIASIEAMAMAVAVVATDVEGLRNIIVPGETGFLGGFDEGVASGLANLTLDLLQDPRHRRDLGLTGRESVKQRFSIERMQAELESVYEEVLSERNRRS